MKYAIINTAKGEIKGINSTFHRKSANRQRMLVNEDTLRAIGGDADLDALVKELDGELMTAKEAESRTSKWK